MNCAKVFAAMEDFHVSFPLEQLLIEVKTETGMLSHYAFGMLNFMIIYSEDDFKNLK